MVQENDLRLGNKVEVNGKIIEVESISDEGINVWRDRDGEWLYGYSFKSVNPIPLTKDILQKCGFEKDNHPPQDIWSNDFMIIFFNEEFGFYTGYWKTNFEIKYIHQLQNLYYALTGKELEINLIA